MCTHTIDCMCSIIAQERLNRITQFVTEMSLSDHVPSPSLSKDHVNGTSDSPCMENDTDWMASAIPVDSAMVLTAAAAGIIADDKVSSSRWEIGSSGSGTASGTLDQGEVRDLDKDGGKNMHYFGDCTPDSLENQFVEGIYKVDDNGHPPQAGPDVCPRNHTLERLGSFESIFRL